MAMFETQTEKRARLDKKTLNRAYANLANSVTRKPQFSYSRANDTNALDDAVRTCLAHYHIEISETAAAKPGESVTERIDALCGPVGVMWREVKLFKGWRRRVMGTMLGFLKSGEAVPLLPRRLGGYDMVDPATGRHKKVTRKIAASMNSSAICFYRPLPAESMGMRDLFMFMLQCVDMHDYMLIVVALVAATLVGMLPAAANQILFGTVIPSHDEELIAPVCMLLIGVMLSRMLVGIARDIVLARLSAKVRITVEAATMARVFSLPTDFFKKRAAGNLANRVQSVSAMCEQTMSLFVGTGLSSVLSLAYLVQIFAYAPPLVVPSLLVVLVDFVLIIGYEVSIASYQRKALEQNAQVSGLVTALLKAVNKLRMAGAQDRAFARWANEEATYSQLEYNRPPLLLSAPSIVTAVGLLGTAAIYYIATVSSITVADFMSFNVAFGQILGSMMGLSSIASLVATIRPTLELVRPILEAVPELGTNKEHISLVNGSMEVSHVAFRYDESSPYVFTDLSFSIRSGEYVGIVGASGCGKSTILRLLLGFEQPERGSIFYSGKDLAKLDLRSMRRSIGTVMQDGDLFLGTIASNIAIANPAATLEDCWAAAELADVADDIRAMPMGMQTLIMEGAGGVSGGQKQRILIARAICGNRKILMFDEATSALDNIAQQHVTDALAGLKCTRLVIAHRLSTVRDCDRILLVEGGKIAEEGTYKELMAKNGSFADLVRRQQLDDEE